MDYFEIFSSQEWGYNRDEVGACIVRLHQQINNLDRKYASLLKKHKKLTEKYKIFSEKNEWNLDKEPR